METNFSWGYSEYYGVCWVTPTVYGSSGFDLSFYASDGAMYNLQGYTGSPDFSFSLPSVADDDSYITHDVLTWVVPSGIDLTGYDSVGSASFSWYASPDQYSDVALPDWLSEDDLENGTEFFVSSVPYGSYDLFFTLTDEAVYECSYTINVIEGSVPDLLLNPPEDSADGDSDNDPNLMYYTIAAIFAILLIGALVGYAMKGRK
jgi:hypothetical protein